MNDPAPLTNIDRAPPARSISAAATWRKPAEPEQLMLDLDGYEGPIDLLLSLAQAQKLDLGRISILALAEQYLGFIAGRRLELAVAADYLVMAAVLAWLKSCLLLPSAPKDDEPDAAELAETLQHRMALLAAMQEAGRRLMARPQLGRDFLLRGVPEATIVNVLNWEVGLYEVLRAYGERHQRRGGQTLAIAPSVFHSMDEALRRIARFLGRVRDWRELSSFLPTAHGDGEDFRRSAVAATFAAMLELARSNRLELRQDRPFGPIWLRRTPLAAARG